MKLVEIVQPYSKIKLSYLGRRVESEAN